MDIFIAGTAYQIYKYVHAGINHGMGVSSVIHGEEEVLLSTRESPLGRGRLPTTTQGQLLREGLQDMGHGASPLCSPSRLHQGADGEN